MATKRKKPSALEHLASRVAGLVGRVTSLEDGLANVTKLARAFQDLGLDYADARIATLEKHVEKLEALQRDVPEPPKASIYQEVILCDAQPPNYCRVALRMQPGRLWVVKIEKGGQLTFVQHLTDRLKAE